MPEFAPAAYSIPLFVSALALTALAVFHAVSMWRQCRRLPLGDIMWSVFYVALLLVVGIFCLLGGIDAEAGILDLGAYAVALFLCGTITLMRNRISDGMAELPIKLRAALRAVAIVCVIAFVSIVSAWMIDYVWLDTSGSIQLQYFAVTVLLFALASVALYFLGQRGGALMAFVPLCALGFGIAQHFVVMFKGTPIMPTDLLSLKTAGAVASGYNYVLTPKMVVALCATAVCACSLSLLKPDYRSFSRRARAITAGASTLVGVVLFAILGGLFNRVKLEEIIVFGYDRFMPINTYQTLGFVPAFIEVAQDLKIPEPEGYDGQQATDLLYQLEDEFNATMGSTPERLAAEAQFNEIRPTVIAVMNETFSDLSIYDAVRDAGYGGPQFYNSLEGTLQRGTLMVSVMGGGTANSEFEFLTGNSMAFIGTGKYPYQLYDLSESDSLVKQFKQLGYGTVAMHPQSAVNWKRSSVYEQLGFDRFLSIEDFESAPVYHSGATDASTYDKILELLEQDAAPQFIFDVTMQNHSGYGEGSVPAEDVVNLDVTGVNDSAVLSELGVYLACINRSDQDLAQFIERLKGIGHPVALVFFGDHQPGLAGTLADSLYADAAQLDREFKKHESTYMVWTNYEVAGTGFGQVRTTSSSQLAAQVLYALGAPLTDRQKADLVLGQSVGAINLLGYIGADGLRYELGVESPYRETIAQMQAIQYLRFTEKLGQ